LKRNFRVGSPSRAHGKLKNTKKEVALFVSTVLSDSTVALTCSARAA
jgi:hypothetical protein